MHGGFDRFELGFAEGSKVEQDGIEPVEMRVVEADAQQARRVLDRLDLTAAYKYDERDNKTPVDTYTPILLEVLPGPSIASLVNLKLLTVQDNLLRELPDEIGRLTQLEDLWASTALWDEVRANPALEIVDEPRPVAFEDDLRLAARLAARFSQGRACERVAVEINEPGKASRTLEVPPMPPEQIPEEWYL